MKLALNLAARGAGWVSPNPMVGAVVVKDGRVVGRGYHRRAGAPHAEVEALAAAGEAARGADLYVTLEPCNHQGRTPPCTQAILAAGVRRVIIAARDPNPQVTGGGAEFLAARGVEVQEGLLAAEARRLNEAWLHYVNTGRPWVMAKAACSLDGKIATVGGESQWLTGEAARALGHRLRHRVDAIVVGIGTVLADNPRLNVRLAAGPDPQPVVVDSRLRFPPYANLLKNGRSPLIATNTGADAERRQALEAAGARVLVLPGNNGWVDLAVLLQHLGSMDINSLMVEGGAQTITSFLASRLVDQVVLTIAPLLVGGLRVVNHFGRSSRQRFPRLKHLSYQQLGDDLVLRGEPDWDG